VRRQPVQLDDEADSSPQEVDFVTIQPDIRLRLLDALAREQREESVLER
jgi:hypothetical protein